MDRHVTLRVMIAVVRDAQRMSLLFQYGAIGADDVVAWADSLIAQLDHLDSSPGLLFALASTSPDKTAEILHCLRELSAGADFWAAFRTALPGLREYIVAHPERADCIANHLFNTLCRFDVSDVPVDLHFAYRFDDAFSLASEGSGGNTETVYQEFLHELDRFKDVKGSDPGSDPTI